MGGAEVEELEAEGAKADGVRKERKDIEKQRRAVVNRAQTEKEHLDRDFETFKKIAVRTPTGAKHGSMIPITERELETLLKAYPIEKE